MSQLWSRAWVVGTVLAILLGGFAADRGSWAQEAAKKTETKERAKAKGYLPPFYRDVIDGVQREKIYQIQDSYEAQINALEAQLKTLRDNRDAEIAALLTPEQAKRLAELTAEAKKKREADGKARESATPKKAAPESSK